MTFEKSRSAGVLASDIGRQYTAALQRRLQPLNLSPAQFLALTQLWAEDGLTQRDLTLRLGVEQATMANTLSRMQRDGLIDRKPHPEDRRSQQVWLSHRAKGLQGPATEAAVDANKLVLAGLPDAERELFLSMMNRVAAALRAASAEFAES